MRRDDEYAGIFPVWDRRRTQAIFREAGSVGIPGRGLLMADRACAGQVRIGYDTVTVSAADPTQSRKRLRLG